MKENKGAKNWGMLTLYPVACTTDREKGNSLSAASPYRYFFSISVVLGTQGCVFAPVQPHACRQDPEARLAVSPAAEVPHMKKLERKSKAKCTPWCKNNFSLANFQTNSSEVMLSPLNKLCQEFKLLGHLFLCNSEWAIVPSCGVRLIKDKFNLPRWWEQSIHLSQIGMLQQNNEDRIAECWKAA